MDRKTATLLGVGIISIGGIVYIMTRRKLSVIGQEAVDNSGLFSMVIPGQAQPYADIILQVASETGVDPFLIAAVGMRESRWGEAIGGPGGTGDAGHGHGIMQIDDRTWGDWLASNDWGDPYTNVKKGAQILAQNLSYFEGKGLTGDELTRAAAAGYNAGPGRVWLNITNPDVVTANGNYGSDVLAQASSMAGAFGAQV